MTTARSTSGSSGTALTCRWGSEQVDGVTQSIQSVSGAPDAATRTAAVRRVLLIVLACNLVVLLTKNVIAVRTGALAVLGATLESGLDVLGNLMGILLVAVSTRAPDDDHPYGHAKFETLGTLGIVGFLSISCFELLREGASALIHGQPPRQVSTVDIGALMLTLVVN